MAVDFEKVIQTAVELLKLPLRPMPRPPRGDAQAQTLRIPMRNIAFPPDCPGCGKPAQREFEVVYEDINFVFVIIAALSRSASPATYRLNVPFCDGCAGAIELRRTCIWGRLILLVIAVTLLQIPMAMLRGFGREHFAFYTLIHYLSVLPIFAAIALMIWWSFKIFRKTWYFGFRITGADDSSGMLRVRIDDPGYAARLQALCHAAPPASASPPLPPPAAR